MDLQVSSRFVGLRQAVLQLASLTMWLGLWIMMPIALWLGDDEYFPALASLGVLAHLAASLSAVRISWTARRIIRCLAVIFVFTWLVEALGSATGIPFGAYDYTSRLPLRLIGVPLIIPLAWAMMLFPAWAVTESILAPYYLRLGRFYGWIYAALAGAAFTAWDLYLDPQMVARGLWVWDSPGGYFGIPWANYLGWWLSAVVLSLVLRPERLVNLWLLIIYTLTWLFQAIGLGIFWGQPGPALVGFVIMGIFVLWSWRSYRAKLSLGRMA